MGGKIFTDGGGCRTSSDFVELGDSVGYGGVRVEGFGDGNGYVLRV